MRTIASSGRASTLARQHTRRHPWSVTQREIRLAIRQEQRKENDMPPRGRKKKWEGAVRHAASLPPDHIALWECGNDYEQHRFFTIGPVVFFDRMLLCKVPPDMSMTGGSGVRIVRCHCGSNAVALLRLPREITDAARAAWRVDGERAAHSVLLDTVGVNMFPIDLPYFLVTEAKRWDSDAGAALPYTSMQEGLTQIERYLKGQHVNWGL